jgi:hypothetical protein
MASKKAKKDDSDGTTVVADNVVSKKKTSARAIKKAEKDGKAGMSPSPRVLPARGRRLLGRMRVELTTARMRRMRKLE